MKSRAKAGKACFRFLHFFMLHFGVFAFAPFVVYMFQDVDCALLAPQTLLPRVSGLCSTLSIYMLCTFALLALACAGCALLTATPSEARRPLGRQHEGCVREVCWRVNTLVASH